MISTSGACERLEQITLEDISQKIKSRPQAAEDRA